MNNRIKYAAWVVVVLLLVLMKPSCKAQSNVAGNVILADWDVSATVTWVDASTVHLVWNFHTADAEALDRTVYLIQASADSSDFSTAGAVLLREKHSNPGAGGNYQVSGSLDASISPGKWVYIQSVKVQGSDTFVSDRFYSKYVVADKKVTLKLRNTSNVTLRYQLLDGNGNQIGSDVVLQPGQALIQSFTLPGSTPTPLSVVYKIDGVAYEGGLWTVDEGAVTTVTATKDGKPVTGAAGESSVTVQDTSGSLIDVIDPPAVVPSGGLVNRDGSIWKNATDVTTPTDVLTKPVFREGVDKITSRLDAIKSLLNDGSVTEVQFDSEAPGTAVTSMAKGSVVGLVGKLPAPPEITMPGTVSHFAFDLQVPGITQPQHVDIDFEQYETQILVFRSLIVGAMAILFFFLAVKAIKDAFA